MYLILAPFAAGIRDNSKAARKELPRFSFTPAGKGLFGATLSFAALALVAPQTQAHLPLSYLLGVWIVTTLAGLCHRASQVVLRTHCAGSAFAGERLLVHSDLDFETPPSGATRVIPRDLPPGIALEKPRSADVSFPKGENAGVATLHLRCRRRGVYLLKPFEVQSVFPLGLLQSSYRGGSREKVVVYPASTPLAALEFPRRRRFQPRGLGVGFGQWDSQEYYANREYQPGDRSRDFNWPATARLSRPVVREYREEYALRAAIVLDGFVPAVSGGAGARLQSSTDGFEAAVSACASLAEYLLGQGFGVEVFVSGANVLHLTAGSGTHAWEHVLDFLVGVQSGDTDELAQVESRVAEIAAELSVVLCVFRYWDEPRSAFVARRLAQGGVVRAWTARSDSDPMDHAQSRDSAGPIGRIGAGGILEASPPFERAGL